MKPAIVLVAVLGTLVVGSIVLSEAQNAPVTYENPNQEVSSTSTPETAQEAVQVDVIDEMQRELDRINAELDAEEQRLLEERDNIDARLDRIRETRMSFQ